MVTAQVTVLVKVTVAADGTPKALSIYKSSGYTVLDNAALRSVRRSSYSPTMRRCVPVEEDYLFRVDFRPG
jgi:protein TonB